MNERPDAVAPSTAAIVNLCWNTIGVRGDGSCPELREYVHCRNCPVYSAGAAARLDSEAPEGYLATWMSYVAAPGSKAARKTESVVIFRVASEWLALPTSAVVEVANARPVHSLPHRRNGIVLGLTNIRGELLVCVSLGQVVGVDAPIAASGDVRHKVYPRLLVVRGEDVRAVCPVDEVYGVHRFRETDLRPVPATVAKATVTYSTAVLKWGTQSVGVLDDQLLFYALRRSLA
jgi:chemotaxis-related protein WspD